MNALTELLRQPSQSRTAPDYERVFDDYIRFAGGDRIAGQFLIPPGIQNADYYLPVEPAEIVVELKQLTAYRRGNTVDQYFAEQLRAGRLKRFETLPGGKIRITPDSMDSSSWNRFYKRFCPTVTNDLKKAERQLRMTDAILPEPSKRRVRGVMLLNSGNFNLPTDLLLRLVEWKVKREWKSGHLRSIEFVSCVTLDMFREGQHPLYARHIARSGTDEPLVDAVRYLYDRWVHYGAEAVGATVEFQAGAAADEAPPNLSLPFGGKIGLTPRTSD